MQINYEKTHLFIYIYISILCFDTFSQISPTFCEGQTISSSSTFSICDENPWLLIFEDEFNDNTIDTNLWSIVTGVPRDPNFEKQKAWHISDNIQEEGGVLKVISKRDSVYHRPVVKSWDPYIVEYEDFAFTTGEIWSKFKFGYGKYEARIKIPKGKGLWPAFWLWCGSPKYNENDIFEFWKNNTTTHNITTHFDFNNSGDIERCSYSYNSTDFSYDYHIFTLEWENGQTKWYVDGDLKRIDFKYYTILGQPYSGCTIQKNHSYILNKVYPNSPMNIIFNTAIETGSYAPDSTTPFPSCLMIDWIKYYKKTENIDVQIDSTNIEIEEGIYNLGAGKTITVENLDINSTQQLALVATDSIIFVDGFQAKKGSFVTAKIR